MKKLIGLLFIVIFTFSTAHSQNACNGKRSAHIRLVGDSWAHFPSIYAAYDSALAKYGFADYFAIGDGSSLISMTAETWWQFPLARFALEAALKSDAVRPIDIIMVSLGGNDVAFKIRHGDSLSILDNSLNEAKLFMDSIFDFIHETYPNGHIIWQSYDYTNFNDPCLDFPWDPYCDLWKNKGYPTPYEINRFMGYITDYQDSVIRSYNKPYMHFFNNLGLMQWRYGQTTPLRFPPYGTYPPRSVTLPYGDINYPSPHAAMGLLGIDTYHLGPQGFTYLAEAYMRQFISNYLRRDRDTSTYSMGKNYDGWVSENAISGTGDVLVGKRNNQNTRGIFSFDTEFIPDNMVIKKADLFFKCKDIKTLYPLSITFPQTFSLDIKSGAFGNAEIEASDYNAPATMNDIACFAGKLRGVDYALRADIKPEALKYINKTGLTQFRLDVTDDNLITFFNGDTTAFEGPFLDVYYDTTTIISGIKNNQNIKENLNLFPNPGLQEITIQITKEWKNKNLSLSVYNVEGAMMFNKEYNQYTNDIIKLDISSFASGSYFVYLENGTISSSGSFEKIK